MYGWCASIRMASDFWVIPSSARRSRSRFVKRIFSSSGCTRIAPEYIPMCIFPEVGVTGFEPATSASRTRRSSQAEPHPGGRLGTSYMPPVLTVNRSRCTPPNLLSCSRNSSGDLSIESVERSRVIQQRERLVSCASRETAHLGKLRVSVGCRTGPTRQVRKSKTHKPWPTKSDKNAADRCRVHH